MQNTKVIFLWNGANILKRICTLILGHSSSYKALKCSLQCRWEGRLPPVAQTFCHRLSCQRLACKLDVFSLCWKFHKLHLDLVGISKVFNSSVWLRRPTRLSLTQRMSSAWTAEWPWLVRPSLLWCNCCKSVSMTRRKSTGDRTYPCRTPLLMLKEFSTTFHHTLWVCVATSSLAVSSSFYERSVACLVSKLSLGRRDKDYGVSPSLVNLRSAAKTTSAQDIPCW